MLTGYMTDSSWFVSRGGGHRYHLTGEFENASLCGLAPMLAGTTATPWYEIQDILKCKYCVRINANREAKKLAEQIEIENGINALTAGGSAK